MTKKFTLLAGMTLVLVATAAIRLQASESECSGEGCGNNYNYDNMDADPFHGAVLNGQNVSGYVFMGMVAAKAYHVNAISPLKAGYSQNDPTHQ